MRIEQGSALDKNSTAAYSPVWRRQKTEKPPVAEPEFATEIMPSSSRPFFSITNRNYDASAMYVSTTTDGANHFFSKIRLDRQDY